MTSRYKLEIDGTLRDFINITTTETVSSDDPDTFKAILDDGSSITHGDAFVIYRDDVVYMSGIIEEINPETTANGNNVVVGGRQKKVFAWRKWTERREDPKISGFFKDFYPHQVIKFILRRPKSDSPTVGYHRLGWGIYHENLAVSTDMGTDPQTELLLSVFNINYTINRIWTSGWRSDGNPVSGNYVLIDLGETKTICAVRVDNRNSNYVDDIMTSLVVQTSTDGVDYTTRDSITGNSALNLYFSFTPVAARYVKIAVGENQSNPWYIGELFVYESEGEITGINIESVATGHGVITAGIDQTYMRVSEAINSIVEITETDGTPWEWWIDNDGNFYFAQRRGSDKSATVSLVYGSEFTDVRVERTSNKRVDRVLVIGKGEGNEQDKTSSGWVGTGEYEDVVFDTTLINSDACSDKADIVLAQKGDIVTSINCSVEDPYDTGDWGVGDDVTLTDINTGLSGKYRIKKIIREYSNKQSEETTIEASNAYSAFSDDYTLIEKKRRITEKSYNYSLADLDDPEGPPATVTSLVATAVIQGVELIWDNNTENDLDHYIVYRGTDVDPTGEYYYTRSNQVIDKAVVYGTTYHYRVKAVDRVGNESTDYSNDAYATPSKVDTTDIGEGTITDAHLQAGAVIASAMAKGVQPFITNITFTPKTGSETTIVSWSSGTISFSDTTTQSIDAGETTTLTAGVPYYVYFTVGSSTLAYSTTYSQATTATTQLLAMIMRSGTAGQEVLIQPFGAKGANYQADVIAAGAVLADAIASQAIVIGKIHPDLADTFFSSSDDRSRIEAWQKAGDLTFIDGGKIYTGSITALQVTIPCIDGDGYIKLGYIGSGDLDDISDGTNYYRVKSTEISAGYIKLTTTQNMATQGLSIVTAASGQRIEITSSAITGYNSIGVEQFYLSATDGKAYCGGGNVAMGSEGIVVSGVVSISDGGVSLYGNTLQFYDGATLRGGIGCVGSSLYIGASGDIGIASGANGQTDVVGYGVSIQATTEIELDGATISFGGTISSDIVPYGSGNTGYNIGAGGAYYNGIVCDTLYYDSALTPFDEFDDLKLAQYDTKIGRDGKQVIDVSTMKHLLPDEGKCGFTKDNKERMFNSKKTMAFLLGCAKQTGQRFDALSDTVTLIYDELSRLQKRIDELEKR